eukprot:TRINITY_DN113639_c0_g1_i1.p1 TRINITY_DN113639_c0_g1~~TRINITY_DN113639_c0_g1_i1.p1  ORF type:complete len:526 (-),score=309.51 TRINITY_DN113639_c0_g1_i1:124-1653(-)
MYSQGVTYGHKTLMGNWAEDAEAEEQQQAEFLARKARGELLVDKVGANLARALKPVKLSYDAGSFWRYGHVAMVRSIYTGGYLCVDDTEQVAGVEKAFTVTTSLASVDPAARNTFVVEPYDGKKQRREQGDKVMFGDLIKLRVNPELRDKAAFVFSTRQTPIVAAKYNEQHQLVCAAESKGYETAWRIDHADVAKRFAMRGQQGVRVGDKVVLTHALTSECLGSDRTPYINDFGEEFEVTGHSYTTKGKKAALQKELSGQVFSADVGFKAEFEQNHWTVVLSTVDNGTGNDEDEDAKHDAAAAAQRSGMTLRTMPEVQALLSRMRAQLSRRGPVGIRDIGRKFRIMDDDGSAKLDVDEFFKGLRDQGLRQLNNDDLTLLRAAFDTNDDGEIDYEEFLSAIRGRMPPAREEYVNKAFALLDANKNGVLQIDDIQQRYNAAGHPLVLAGKKTEEQVLSEFLNNFEAGSGAGIGDGKVTKKEFKEYYEAVSACVDRDDYFALMMENAWKGFK